MTDVPSPQIGAATITCTQSGQSLLSTRATRLWMGPDLVPGP